jgi:hypothetical protein
MRSALAHGFRFVSVTLLASLAGCSDDPSPSPVDAGVDVVTPADVPAIDAPATDTPAVTDTTPVASDVPAGECGSISPEVAAHVTAMSTMGWGALNRGRSMMMHGCAGAARPQDCLATVPLVSDADIGANRSAITGAHLRVLYTSTTRSGFWTRGSADGRFVGRSTRARPEPRRRDHAPPAPCTTRRSSPTTAASCTSPTGACAR